MWIGCKVYDKLNKVILHILFTNKITLRTCTKHKPALYPFIGHESSYIPYSGPHLNLASKYVEELGQNYPGAKAHYIFRLKIFGEFAVLNEQKVPH